MRVNAPFDDARRLVRLVDTFDFDRTFVDDDDENDLRGVGDRREALQHLDPFELVCGAESGRHLLEQVWSEGRADLDACILGRDRKEGA